MNKNLYWFSFSYKGEHQGVCTVKANSPDEALQKTIDLKIHPAHDDIACFEVSKLDNGIVYDKLYSKAEMIALGYTVKQL